MNINYKLIIAQLTAFLQGLFIKDLPLVEETGLAYLDATEKRLETLAANAAKGDLSKDEVIQALKDEKDIFISELKSFEIEGECLAQDAINNAEQIFTDIVAGVIPAA
jgi:hypothetical protein